jgi:hypothetical protein
LTSGSCDPEQQFPATRHKRFQASRRQPVIDQSADTSDLRLLNMTAALCHGRKNFPKRKISAACFCPFSPFLYREVLQCDSRVSTVIAQVLLQSFILFLRIDQNRQIGAGLLPRREEILIGHLALLLPQHQSAREGVWPAKMLVRALKLLGYFLRETTGRDIATAALDQPGDEGCAYGRAQPDWQR